MTAVLEARGLEVDRGGRLVAAAEWLDVREHETIAILGPNGAGKTSLLLSLATLLPARGEILHRGRPIDDRIAFRRRTAFAFQRPLLLDLSVIDNAALGLELRGVPRAERRRRALAALERFGVAGLAGRSAIALSGGESQRVSLARAFAVEPEILFLDEPFSALDAPTRETLVADLARVLREEGVATVLVTHDRDEALSLSDRIAVLIDGRVRQVDKAETVFGMPADPQVAAFVGIENVLPAKVEAVTEEITRLRVADAVVEVTELPPAGDHFPLLCIRPDDVVIARVPPAGPPGRVGGSAAAAASSARNAFAARVVRLDPIGRRVRVTLDCGFPLVAHVTTQSARELALATGDAVTASFKATVPHLLPRHRGGTSRIAQ